MKTFVTSVLLIAIVTTFIFTNFVLVTTGIAIGDENGNILISVATNSGYELFVLTDRPEIHTGDIINLVFYTPGNPETWEIKFANVK